MPAVSTPRVHYPDSDGKRMADNTLQYDWIGTLKWNLEAAFRDRPDVFVAGDHLIYPAEGKPKVRQAPDVYVAFGRPKGDRGSYRVWEEGGVFPQVVFEVWSPHNRFKEMEKKLLFYQRFGAEEYYILYPEFPATIDARHRDSGGRLVPVNRNGRKVDLVSPRLGVRLTANGPGEILIYGPDGLPFLRPDRIAAEWDRERQRADEERRRADAAAAERDALRARLRALGHDPAAS